MFEVHVSYKLGPRSRGHKALVIQTTSTEMAYVLAREFLIDTMNFQPADFSVELVQEIRGNVYIARG